MKAVVRSARGALISPTPLFSQEKFAHAAANILALNPPTRPAFELRRGVLELEVDTKTIVALTGAADASVDGKKAESWAAHIAEKTIRVKTDSVAYVSLRGLNVPAIRPLPLRGGEVFQAEQANGVGTLDLRALRVPATLRAANGDWLESIARVQRHVSMVLEAVKKGAKLVKIHVGGGEFEAWVLELA